MNGQSSISPNNSLGETNPMESGVGNGGEIVERLERELEKREERVIMSELESEEAILPKGFAKIYTPTKEEFERHCLTHLPYRNWCPICVQAKKKNQDITE